MTEYRNYKLGDICKIKYGKEHKGLSNGPIPVYGSGGIMRYAEKSLSKKPSVLIPRKGTLGNLFFTDQPFWTADTLFWTEIDETIVEPLYLYYLLKSKDLAALNVGTAVPSLTTEVLNAVTLLVPALSEQRRVCLLLNTLDRKSKVNQQINDYLAETASTLYKSFVVEESNELHQGTLSELIEVKYGKNHKKLAEGDVPVYGSGGLMRKVDKSLYEGQSVLIPRKGSLNNVMFVDSKFWTVDTMFYSIEKYQGAAKYAYEYLKTQDLASMNSGSAVPSMTTVILNALPLKVPSLDALKRLDTQLQPLYEAQQANAIESETLANVRDTLLPKLMSGDIDVSAVDLTQLNNHLAYFNNWG